MSSRIFQSVIIQMKDATKRVVGVIDSEGVIIASSDLSIIGQNLNVSPYGEEHFRERILRSGGRTFKALGVSSSGFGCAVFVEGEDELAQTVCMMASIAISEARIFFEENHDKSAFIKSVISDNVLPGDIYVRAKELHFVLDVTRVVFVIRLNRSIDSAVIEFLHELFPDRQQDFIISISEMDIAIIKELGSMVDPKAINKLAATIETKFSEELGISTVIGVGTPARHMRELADKYKEALTAIDIGKVFEPDNTIISYESLGLGRLIYQLPITLCEMFLSEVFKKNPIESLDQETLFTIDKFFKNNLNVSETSRKLFVHRNTLVYRLEKIKKITGLDLREFDHAIIFKVALMVKKYLVSQEQKF